MNEVPESIDGHLWHQLRALPRERAENVAKVARMAAIEYRPGQAVIWRGRTWYVHEFDPRGGGVAVIKRPFRARWWPRLLSRSEWMTAYELNLAFALWVMA